MIDPAGGRIEFQEPPWSASPALTRDEFLASPVGRAAEVFVVGAMEYISYKVPRAVAGGVPFIVVLWFDGQRLYRVSLSAHEPEFGTSWSDWSEAAERERKEIHDRWLDRALPAGRRRAAWGDVASYYSERDAESRIDVNYR
jgi:hypothetical protein